MAVDASVISGGGRPWWQYALLAGGLGVGGLVLLQKLHGSGDSGGTLNANASIAFGSVQQQLLEIEGLMKKQGGDIGSLLDMQTKDYNSLASQLKELWGQAGTHQRILLEQFRELWLQNQFQSGGLTWEEFKKLLADDPYNTRTSSTTSTADSGINFGGTGAHAAAIG